MRSAFGIAALAILALVRPLSAEDDWPSWRGENRDGRIADGVPVPTKLPAEPKVLWHVPVGSGFASRKRRSSPSHRATRRACRSALQAKATANPSKGE